NVTIFKKSSTWLPSPQFLISSQLQPQISQHLPVLLRQAAPGGEVVSGHQAVGSSRENQGAQGTQGYLTAAADDEGALRKCQAKGGHRLKGGERRQSRPVRQGRARQGVQEVQGNGVHCQILKSLGQFPALGHALAQPQDAPGANAQARGLGGLNGGYSLPVGVGAADSGKMGSRALQVVVVAVKPGGLQVLEKLSTHNAQGGAHLDGRRLADGGHRLDDGLLLPGSADPPPRSDDGKT